MTDIKKNQYGFNNRFNMVEETISEFEDWSVEVTQHEQREQRLKKNEQSLINLWEHDKHFNVSVMGIQIGEEEKYFNK